MEENELDSTCGISDDEMTKLFTQAVRIETVIQNMQKKPEIIVFAGPKINVYRVKQRFANGGHDVPEDKIVSRYKKALDLLPELIQVCDICHIYDNSNTPFRIFKKRRIFLLGE